HCFEGLALAAPIKEIGWRKCESRYPRKAGLRWRVIKLYERVRLVKWQRAQQDRIDHAEDRGIRADAEGEGEHGDGRESGILAQHAQAEAQILDHRFEYRETAAVAIIFYRLVDASQRE